MAESVDGRGNFPPSEPGKFGLHDRLPEHGVIEKVLAGQSQCRPRHFLKQVFGADPLAAGNHSWYKGALGKSPWGTPCKAKDRNGPCSTPFRSDPGKLTLTTS